MLRGSDLGKCIVGTRVGQVSRLSQVLLLPLGVPPMPVLAMFQTTSVPSNSEGAPPPPIQCGTCTKGPRGGAGQSSRGGKTVGRCLTHELCTHRHRGPWGPWGTATAQRDIMAWHIHRKHRPRAPKICSSCPGLHSGGGGGPESPHWS